MSEGESVTQYLNYNHKADFIDYDHEELVLCGLWADEQVS
jgi:hypothetical protein